MLDIIEELSTDTEWMDRFCKDCKAVWKTPTGYDCPAERNPFDNTGCVKSDMADSIAWAAREVEIRAAVAADREWTDSMYARCAEAIGRLETIERRFREAENGTRYLHKYQQ